MNEQTLINMLSELDASSLKENFTEKDLRNKDGNVFKRAYFYIRSLNRKDDTVRGSILKDHLEEYVEASEEIFIDTETVSAMEAEEEEQEQDAQQRGFTIHVFKRSIKNLITIITAIVAALIVIIGLVIVLIRRKHIFKLFKKVQISY
jgi:hypothetical protein